MKQEARATRLPASPAVRRHLVQIVVVWVITLALLYALQRYFN